MKLCRRKHQERMVYDGTENYRTAVRWCSRCGAIKHPIVIKRSGALSRRLYWQFPMISKEGGKKF